MPELPDRDPQDELSDDAANLPAGESHVCVLARAILRDARRLHPAHVKQIVQLLVAVEGFDQHIARALKEAQASEGRALRDHEVRAIRRAVASKLQRAVVALRDACARALIDDRA